MIRFPSYLQLDTMDCGPTCLRIISSYYGKNYSLQFLRNRCHISRNGVSMLGISDAAESIGFRTAGMKITWEQLRDDANLPCVVHWNQSHFVVVYRIEKQKNNTCDNSYEKYERIIRINHPSDELLYKIKLAQELQLVYYLEKMPKSFIPIVTNNLEYDISKHKCDLSIMINNVNHLPDYHFPFCDYDVLSQTNEEITPTYVRTVFINQMLHVDKVKLIGKNILNASSLMSILKYLLGKGINVEIIIPFSTFLNNTEVVSSLSKSVHFLVYCDEHFFSYLSHIKEDDLVLLSICSLFCPVKTKLEYKRVQSLLNKEISVVYFPSLSLSNEIDDTLLFYDRQSLMLKKYNKEYFNTITHVNPYFFGKLVLDNNGNLFSFPYKHGDYYVSAKELSTKSLIPLYKGNTFWYMTRKTFFTQCANCAYNLFCPPISNYEIITKRLFCKN